jgi:hypothetical protein
VSYLILWESDRKALEALEDGGKWVGLNKLLSFVELIHEYEVMNYDGPREYPQEYKDAPVDDRIEPDQIWFD